MTSKPETDLEKQIREMQEKMTASSKAMDAEARAAKKGPKAIYKEEGLVGMLHSVGQTTREVAANLAEIVGVIRTAKAVYNWTTNIYNKGTEAVKSVPVIGPIVAWPFRAVPNALYRFCHPYEGENLRQASWRALKNTPVRLGNTIMNGCRSIAGKEKVSLPEDTRERVRSVPRIGVSVLMSAWALSAALNVPVIGDSFDYLAVEPPSDAFRMAVTAVGNVTTGHGFGMTRETLYCGIPTKSTTDDFMEVTCGVKGVGGQFDEDGQTPFISRPGRLMSEAYSWTHGHGPHDPTRVVGAIKPDATKCEVTYYGTRMRIAKWANFKPEILNASCQAAGSGVSSASQAMQAKTALSFQPGL